MFGVIRREILQQTSLLPNFAGSDRPMLAELALLGRFRCANERLFLKRQLQPDIEIVGMLSPPFRPFTEADEVLFGDGRIKKVASVATVSRGSRVARSRECPARIVSASSGSSSGASETIGEASIAPTKAFLHNQDPFETWALLQALARRHHGVPAAVTVEDASDRAETHGTPTAVM